MKLTIKSSVSDTGIRIWTTTSPAQLSSADLTQMTPEYLENLLAPYTRPPGSVSHEALKRFTREHKALYFSRLVVNPEVRRKGVGTALCQTLRSIVERDKLCIFLEARPYTVTLTQQDLLTFYKKNGFTHIEGQILLLVPESANQFACTLGTTKGLNMSIRN